MLSVKDSGSGALKNIKKTGINVKRKGSVVTAEQTGDARVMNHVDNDAQTPIFFDIFDESAAFIFIDYLNGTFLDRTALLFLLLLINVIPAMYSSIFGWLLVIHLVNLDCYDQRLHFINYLSEKGKIAKKWWWPFLLTNISFLLKTCYILNNLPFHGFLFFVILQFPQFVM